jgi:hypothetical protein
MSAAFGKMAVLLTSKAKQMYGGQISNHIWQILGERKNTAAIISALKIVPKGYILV